MSEVPTARGDSVESSELGFTSMCEKVFLFSTPDVHQNWPDTLGNLDSIVAKAVEDVRELKENGMDTFVDRALPGIGRNVPLIKRVAEQVPLNIIVTTGYYIWRDLPLFFFFRNQPEIKGGHSMDYYFQRDIEEGIGDTGVRAGVIKCVTDRFGMTEGVDAAVRAVCRVHRRTGVPITTHVNGIENAFQQLDVFEEEGVDPSRVYICHVDKTPDEDVEQVEQVIERGASVSFDMLGATKNELYGASLFERNVKRVTELCERGRAGQLLLGNDNCSFQDLVPDTSQVAPWTTLTDTFIPALRERGVTDEQINQMMIDNPRRILETRDLGPY